MELSRITLTKAFRRTRFTGPSQFARAWGAERPALRQYGLQRNQGREAGQRLFRELLHRGAVQETHPRCCEALVSCTCETAAHTRAQPTP